MEDPTLSESARTGDCEKHTEQVKRTHEEKDSPSKETLEFHAEEAREELVAAMGPTNGTKRPSLFNMLNGRRMLTVPPF